MNMTNPEYVANMRDALSDFLDGVRRLDPGLGTPPVKDSIADREWQTFPKPSLLVDAYGLAGLLVESAADHIDAFLKAITEPVTPIASCTCIRSTLEPCALATWIAAPEIGAHERGKRMYSLRYDALEEGKKFVRAAQASASLDTKTADRIGTLEREALRLGYPRVVDKNGKRIGIGCKKPDATKLIADVLGEEAKYRLLSAVAHGQHWALRNLGFMPAESDGVRLAVGGVPVAAFRKTVHVNVVADLGLCALRSFSRPVACMLQYSGNDSRQFDRLLKATFDSLRVPKLRRRSSTPT